LRHLIRVMRRHDLAKKMTTTKTKTKIKTMTKTNTLRAPSKSDPSDSGHLRHWLHF